MFVSVLVEFLPSATALSDLNVRETSLEEEVMLLFKKSNTIHTIWVEHMCKMSVAEVKTFCRTLVQHVCLMLLTTHQCDGFVGTTNYVYDALLPASNKNLLSNINSSQSPHLLTPTIPPALFSSD